MREVTTITYRQETDPLFSLVVEQAGDGENSVYRDEVGVWCGDFGYIVSEMVNVLGYPEQKADALLQCVWQAKLVSEETNEFKLVLTRDL